MSKCDWFKLFKLFTCMIYTMLWHWNSELIQASYV